MAWWCQCIGVGFVSDGVAGVVVILAAAAVNPCRYPTLYWCIELDHKKLWSVYSRSAMQLAPTWLPATVGVNSMIVSC